MKSINPYLNFLGNTEEVFNFYKSVLGGEFATFQRFSDTPHGDSLPAADRDKIMHITLITDNGITLMATDALESAGHTVNEGNNFSLAITTESEAESDKIFNGLAAGGTITMPLEKTFWGAYFGMLTDKFGIQWMVNYDLPK